VDRGSSRRGSSPPAWRPTFALLAGFLVMMSRDVALG
jgi:hypothetical protein